MDVSVLGPVEVRVAGAAVDLGTPKQKALVAALALTPGRAVAVDTIVDLLWGESPPASVSSTLQGYVSHLRRVLEPGRTRRAASTVLVTVAPGYALAVPAERVDAHAFEATVARCREPMREFRGWGAPPVAGGDLERIVADLEEALARWRGTPYGDLGDAPGVAPERSRLEELRMVAVEDRVTAELALGRHTAAAVELEPLTAQHPLRERLWALRAVALQRSGRQADALATLRELREVLDTELGLEPSPAIRDLETALLRQDPDLAWMPPVAEATLAPPPQAEPGPASAAEPVVPAAPWPLLGRETELAALEAALERAQDGAPTFAVLTGEPGIGKSRLAAELVARAEAAGARVLLGRCSQDDGAPPLWPWRGVLTGLGVELPPPGPTDDVGASFRVWEQIVAELDRAAREALTVVVLDDLHWADTSTLRVLGLLAEVVTAGRLLLVTTWRDQEVGPALADVAEALARRHAVRLDLGGLPPDAAREVFCEVSRNRITADQGEALWDRTGGNPFFLVEYARLAGERTDVDELTREPPVAVTDVVRRRLAKLDDKTVEVLRVAAVVGRRFDTDTVAAVVGTDPDLLLDLVEPAQAAGLVEEEAIDWYVFVHALVRDSLLIGSSASRRARTHARVAEALEAGTGRESEVALHWLAAGPAHAGRAWRAAASAAEQARGLHAHEEAADLLVAALGAMDDDPDAGAGDRYALLMDLIEAHRWSARLPELVAAVERAIEAAEDLGDLERAARAALSATEGGLWQSAPPGTVNERVVATLRSALEASPPGDGELRCRVLLGLANEESHVVPPAETRRLVEEALAMAERLNDPRLRLHARQLACSTIWTPATAEERLDWSAEAVSLARSIGDDQALVVSSTLRTVVLSELGRLEEMGAAAVETRAEAERLRIPYGELVLGAVQMSWLVLSGRYAEGAELLERMQVLAGRVTEPFAGQSVVAAQATLWMWHGEEVRAADFLHGLDSAPYPLTPVVVALLLRGGERERAEAHLELVGRDALVPGPDESALSTYMDAHAAEVGLRLGDVELAAACYRRLTPYAGRSAQAGSALNAGPVDAFLAMAAAATGDRGAAAEHADAALARIDEWGLTVARAWFERVRADFAF